ncbi:hypothetical protein COU54_03460 [Candidatus Pacearchaeota archaeon CG10_big_fil_rev_8_21_14_0_10_31_24]|nr:MAG: hypothetical protein COU54_03460 [Candidatus Pacearchaeota archaeon CG10_big_fil_rev_8_21_14_0_10_31_24]
MVLNFIEVIFFFYIFVSLYMVCLMLLIYIPNRKKIFEYPKGKPEPVSIIVPCFNEGAHLGKAIESYLSLDYPKNMIEVIVVDDMSSDNSVEIARRYEKKYKNVRVIVNSRNSGGAAEPTNLGIKAAKYNYIAVADADSEPNRDALLKMIGFLQEDKSVVGVTCSVLSKEPSTFIQKLQAVEYAVIAWGRKLLDMVDAVYVTPGPFALYKKKVLIEVGLFDTKNMTQDIEIVWRLLYHGYKVRMSLDTAVYSATPFKFKKWFRQRVRWNIGGTQTLIKYKSTFFKKGMLGAFILPYFSMSLFLGLLGLALFIYLSLRNLFIFYMSTRYSLYADSALIHFQALNFAPSILNLFGVSLFIVGTIFTLIGIEVMKRHKMYHNLFNVLFYLTIYLTIYPFIMVTSLYRLSTGTYKW